MSTLRDFVTKRAVEVLLVLATNFGGLKQALAEPMTSQADFQEVVTTQTNPKDFHELKLEITRTAVAYDATTPPNLLPDNLTFHLSAVDGNQIDVPNFPKVPQALARRK